MPNRQRNAPRPLHDPATTLDPMLAAMQTQLAHAKRQAAVSVGEQHRLRQWVEHHLRNAAGWEARAVLAVRAGDDDLARQALQRKAQCNEDAASCEAQWREHSAAVQVLRTSLDDLAQRIAAAYRQRNALVARTAAAQARLSIAATLWSLEAHAPHNALEQMEHRVVQLEAQAEAAADLHAWGEDSLEAQFRALEAGTTEDALASLKARMGVTAALRP